MSSLIVVIGDVHHHLWLAVRELKGIEQSLGRPIDQVFSVGDLELFLEEEDWRFLTGPAKYRHPEHSPRIRQAWEEWRWPISMIAGNHEPFHRLRNWEPDYFSGKLRYTDAGELSHTIPGLRVYGLSGIFHPGELEFSPVTGNRDASRARGAGWPDLVESVRRNSANPKRLTYYKQEELDRLLRLPPHPHLLLTHDWPLAPAKIRGASFRRPETELVRRLQPQFACCGHHHTPSAFDMAGTRVRALDIIGRAEDAINPGWSLLLEWDGERLSELSLLSQGSLR